MGSHQDTMKVLISIFLVSVAEGANIGSFQSTTKGDAARLSSGRQEVEPLTRGQLLDRNPRQAEGLDVKIRRENCYLLCNDGYYCWDKCSCDKDCPNKNGFDHENLIYSRFIEKLKDANF